MKWTLMKNYTGCMRGRTLYVIPYSMGHVGSKFSKIGFELTDSEYADCNMKIMNELNELAVILKLFYKSIFSIFKFL